MGSLVLRKLGEPLRSRLRKRAVLHGRSLEAEAIAVLEEAVIEPEPFELRPVDFTGPEFDAYEDPETAVESSRRLDQLFGPKPQPHGE